jgi:hypothetical protein
MQSKRHTGLSRPRKAFRRTIYYRIPRHSRALKDIFGPDGFVLIERTIIKEIKKVFLNLKAPASSYTIFDAFEAAGKYIVGVQEKVPRWL